MTRADWDTIVVGAGVLGCATAYHVKRARPDARVLLLDRHDRPGQGNTRRSVALFRDLFTSRTNRDLAGSTIAFFDHLEGELGYRLGLRRYGYYWLVDSGRLRGLSDILDGAGEGGPEVEVHDRSRVVAMLGGDLVPEPRAPAGGGSLLPVDGALLSSNAGTLSPLRLAKWFEGAFRELGGQVEYGFPVSRLLPEASEGGALHVWQDGRVAGVAGPNGTRRAAELVVAAGVWTPGLLDPVGIDSHVKAQKRQAFGLAGPGAERLHHANGFEGGHLPVIVLPSGGVYLKPVRSQGMLLAGCSDRLGRPYAVEEDPLPEEAFLEGQVLPVVEGYLPGLGGADRPVGWAGQYHYNTVDGNPYVFRARNVTVVAGASGSGIMKSDAIGRVAAAVHAGERRAELFDGRTLEVGDLGVVGRRVDRETMII